MSSGSLHRDIRRVVKSGNCSGCGACELISSRVSMRPSSDGFLRPEFHAHGEAETRRQRLEFAAVCPGRTVRGGTERTAVRHKFLGPVVGAWEAWASDERIRHVGSSGGTITALTAWLIETGQNYSVVGASADNQNPRRTVSVQITTKEEALSAAGSRYAPVSNASACTLAGDGRTAFVGKPCEASAIRQLSEIRELPQPPLIISFFCAGVPSQLATDDLVRTLGVGQNSKVAALRYRGHGWPGEFYTKDSDGNAGAMSYDESWGRKLGPTLQWRCKICADGVGENADIVAGDYWRADESGYPLFADQEGLSVLIARTRRGLNIVEDAIREGVIKVRDVELDRVAMVQPLQVDRRRTIPGRLLGRLLSGYRVPRYRGLSLSALAIRVPGRNARAFLGTLRRSLKNRS